MSDAPTDEVKLNGLMFQVLDHAVASIKDTGGPLIPFSITEDASGEKKLTRYVAERLEDSAAQAKKKSEEMRASIVRYALAWDGYTLVAFDSETETLSVRKGDLKLDLHLKDAQVQKDEAPPPALFAAMRALAQFVAGASKGDFDDEPLGLFGIKIRVGHGGLVEFEECVVNSVRHQVRRQDREFFTNATCDKALVPMEIIGARLLPLGIRPAEQVERLGVIKGVKFHWGRHHA